MSSPPSKNSVLNILSEFSLPLIGGVLTAILWANLGYDSYMQVMKTSLVGDWYPLGKGHPISFHFLMNDIFIGSVFRNRRERDHRSGFAGRGFEPSKQSD